jgi:hypothetical protein
MDSGDNRIDGAATEIDEMDSGGDGIDKMDSGGAGIDGAAAEIDEMGDGGRETDGAAEIDALERGAPCETDGRSPAEEGSEGDGGGGGELTGETNRKSRGGEGGRRRKSAPWRFWRWRWLRRRPRYQFLFREKARLQVEEVKNQALLRLAMMGVIGEADTIIPTPKVAQTIPTDRTIPRKPLPASRGWRLRCRWRTNMGRHSHACC